MSSSEIPDDPDDLFRYAVEDGFDAENKDVVIEAFADSVTLLQQSGPDELSPEQLWQQQQVEKSAMPDSTHNIEETWRDGATVFGRYRPTGTVENELVYVDDVVFTPNGETFEMSGIIRVRVEDGEITGWGGNWDKLRLFQQAGIIPPLEELPDTSGNQE